MMARNGAKNFVLASRKGMEHSKLAEVLGNLEKDGVDNVSIHPYSCDVADKSQLQSMILKCSQVMPPIAGVIYGAFVNKVCGPRIRSPSHSNTDQEPLGCSIQKHPLPRLA